MIDKQQLEVFPTTDWSVFCVNKKKQSYYVPCPAKLKRKTQGVGYAALGILRSYILRLILPWSQHSQKRCRSSYNHYGYRNKSDKGRYAVVYRTSSAVRKYSKALMIDIR